MVEVVKYSAKYKAEWDAFVAGSKNGTFLLLRDYVEYHADRFTDHSLLFYHKGRLVALLPANEEGRQVQSHGGLSYAGLVTEKRMKAALMLEVVQAMKSYFQELGFTSILYKAVPHIYHQLPAEEDLYALFRHEAVLCRRDASSVIDIGGAAKYSKDRRWRLSQGKRAGFQVGLSGKYAAFFELERKLLQQKYNTLPAHTAEEMALLASRFPENIRLYTATAADEMLAGVLVYETPQVVHSQYIATSEQGRNVHALDVLLDWLLTEVYPHKRYFSFGISTERQGRYLNEGLIRNKESYGARTIVHDFYELRLA
ncbi:GNAT family N-acetyltransferase [Pontibacter litorisediminis]|uniref:GNAT family N-acetyltransferase n=1 Tax=Pontibacter litorisediminis TaxID=1846260 RepID=UPI0023EBA284|nr:GNAT family N-acetyltransferase [Pontibacter litorisediminis]